MGVIKYWNPETQTWEKAQAPNLTEDFYKKSEVNQKFEELDAADVGAVSKAGDTMSDNLVVRKESIPTIEVASTAQGVGQLSKNANATVDYGTQIIDRDAAGNDATLQVRGSKWSSPADALNLMLRNADRSVSNVYKVYHTGNKPSAEDVGAMPIIDARSADYDMDVIIKSGAHYGIYHINSSTLGTPIKYNKSDFAYGLIISYAGSASYGQQVAILHGASCLFHRRLSSNGTISQWSEIYSELNKPTPNEIGAAPAIQYGTEPVTEGAASSYPDGTLYVVINE